MGCDIESRKVWYFGPETTGPIMLIGVTKGVLYLNEIKDSVVSWVSMGNKRSTVIKEREEQ